MGQTTLGILVPQYMEDEATVGGLLGSIALQQGIDFGEVSVHVYGDGGRRLDPSLFPEYPFELEYRYSGENLGVSHARNELMDSCSCRYVMFCDADDMFWHVGGLFAVFNCIGMGVDVVSPQFVKENPPGSADRFVPCLSDYVHIHGKAFRAEFLRSTGVRFDESLRVQEDTLFTPVVMELAETTATVDAPYYLWRHNPSSLSRSDPHFDVTTVPLVVSLLERLVDTLLGLGREKAAMTHCVYTLVDAYYLLTAPDAQLPELAGAVEEGRAALRGLVGRRWFLCALFPQEGWGQCFAQGAASHPGGGTTVGFREWLADLSGTDVGWLPDSVS